jgi:hypothetical protein
MSTANLPSNFVNKQPHRLHCFYNKRSTFLHGEEGEDTAVAFGQAVSGLRMTQLTTAGDP